MIVYFQPSETIKHPKSGVSIVIIGSIISTHELAMLAVRYKIDTVRGRAIMARDINAAIKRGKS